MRRLMMLMGLAAMAIIFSSPAFAGEWVACAGENQTCRVPGTRMVRYGAGDQWSLKKANDRIQCSNDVFGDPAPGKLKACYYQRTSLPEKERRDEGDRRDRWIRCADEGGYCRFHGPRDVRYGADDQWNYQSSKDGIACNNSEFGDPAPGRVKACYYQEESRPERDDRRRDSWIRCADEGGYCRFHGPRDVRYGADNRWNYQSARNGISCNNNEFGDPAPGRVKACYYQEESRPERDDRRHARWIRCADEGKYCRFRGFRDIRYGADDRWNYKSAKDGIACNNNEFGDPAPGKRKECFIRAD